MDKSEGRVERAIEFFKDTNGFNCAQSIFATYSEAFGLDRETALKLSCGLGAGMGKTGQVCGAVSGAILALGLKYGRYRLEDTESKDRTYALVQEFEKLFCERNKTVNCNELLQIDLRTADREVVREITQKQCSRYVRDAAEILETLI